MSGNFFNTNCDVVDYSMTQPMFYGECIDAGQQHFLPNTETSLLNWL
jgi:hypothetical protein